MAIYLFFIIIKHFMKPVYYKSYIILMFPCKIRILSSRENCVIIVYTKQYFKSINILYLHNIIVSI